MRDEAERSKCSRRAFSKRMVATAAAIITGVSSEWAHGMSLKDPLPEGRYVDFMTHLGQRWAERPALSAGALVQWMDENDIAQAVVQPLVNPEARVVPITTHYVLEETGPYRDRLIPFCAIDPRNRNLDGIKPKVDLLTRYVHAGARGFGEHKIGIPVDDPRNIELFAACAELDLPIVLHMDNHHNMDEPGLPGLEKVLREVPSATFVGHAQGLWASISGDVTQEQMQGYPKGAVTAGGAVDRLMGRYPNLYADLGAGSGANAIQRDPEFGREFLIRRADRLLFGTDYLYPGQNVPQLELYRRMDLPEDVQAKIFRQNARELLGLI